MKEQTYNTPSRPVRTRSWVRRMCLAPKKPVIRKIRRGAAIRRSKTAGSDDVKSVKRKLF
jgi:hypothetical protein